MSAQEYLIESLKKIDARSVTLILEGIEKKQEDDYQNMTFSDNGSISVARLNDFCISLSNRLAFAIGDITKGPLLHILMDNLLAYLLNEQHMLNEIQATHKELYNLLVAMRENLTTIQSNYNSLRNDEISMSITECAVDLGDSDEDPDEDPDEALDELQNRESLLKPLVHENHIDFDDVSPNETDNGELNTPLLSGNTPTPSNTNDKSNGKCKLAIGTSLFFAGAGTGTAVGLAASGKIAIPAVTSLVAKMLLAGGVFGAVAASPILLGITAGLLGAAIVGLTGLVLYGVYKAWKNSNCCKSDDSEQTQDDDTYSDPLGPTNGKYYQRH